MAPAADILEMMYKIISLEVTPLPRVPSTEIRIFLALDCMMHWVASTISTSEVPMPKAMAPKAPWVDVCESPQTMVIPGWVTPNSGPMTCTMPWCADPKSWSSMPYFAQFSRSFSTCMRESLSLMVRSWSTVGTL